MKKKKAKTKTKVRTRAALLKRRPGPSKRRPRRPAPDFPDRTIDRSGDITPIRPGLLTHALEGGKLLADPADFEHFDVSPIRVPGVPPLYVVEAWFKSNRRIVVGLSFTPEGAEIILEAFRGSSDHWGEAGWIGRIVEKLAGK